ncbi:hypothetical protein LTR05_006401 [Lithohypha guttulata]|uniref:Uncharacterized protein n=1 Tax=Lithohypha guttulata TaxID=1690604 RepID=A0AAN7SXU2_9EURO|nr:hypothetical protein LTR05_006401 [Lithohypha guttulata]
MASRLTSFKRAFIISRTPLSKTHTPLLYSRRFQTGVASSTQHPNPQRDAQLDREKIDRQSDEYSKSGTEEETAAQDHAAFDPNSSNDPEEAMKEAGKGNDVNPLDASPANPGLSSGTSEVSGGADKKKSEGGGGREGGGDSTGAKSGGESV